MQADDEQAFTRFVKETEPRLSYALAAAYGPEVGADATADALTYAWENWDKVRVMNNPAGYLYRVGQSRSRIYRRPRLLFPGVAPSDAHDVEPGLPAALESLTRNQRVAVVLLNALEWTEHEAAEFLGVSRSTVRTHAERGLNRLRAALEVTVDA
ncbi:MAG: sigma factor-like helix-turn-helix DNA-binding protein [Acidimicrobiia bacterium]|nr:sigma factor-like helix-turn-helix DNA-binding protein [Acidimicrobiia bacterium]